MTISKSSWFYRAWLATYGDERPAPATVSLCPMFWRVVGIWGGLLLVACLSVVGLVGALWRFVSWVPDATLTTAVEGAGYHLLGALFSVLVFALAIALTRFCRWLATAIRSGFAGTVVGELARAWWHRVCPFVTFADEAKP